MFIRINCLVDKEAGEIFFIPFRGAIPDHNEKVQMTRLRNLAKRKKYIKLKDMLERQEYEYILKDRKEAIYLPEHALRKKYSPEEYTKVLDKIEMDFLNKTIENCDDYECINPVCMTEEEKQQKWRDYIKSYQEEHVDKILQQKKIYYQNKKDTLNEKVECECGSMVSRQNKRRHQLSKKHLSKMN